MSATFFWKGVALLGGRWSGSAVREYALELLELGWTAKQAACLLGYDRCSVTGWAKMAGMSFRRGIRGGGGGGLVDDYRPVLLLLGSPRDKGNGNRLDFADRVLIEARVRDGISLRGIARELGVSASTVSREIARNSLDGVYSSRRGQRLTGERALRPRARKLETDSWLRNMVVEMLNTRFSPRQIENRLRFLYPLDKDKRVSAETIYQAIYIQGRGSLRQELKVDKALRTGRTSRIPASKLPSRRDRPWLVGHHISLRPAEVKDRAVPGHWEGDLVLGKDHKSALITLVERKTRFTMVQKVKGFHDSTTITEQLIEMMCEVPKEIRKTLTWDQGGEMAKHAEFTLASGCEVFFCDPHSPWQRGTNENTNGLIRDFYPKGTDFRKISDDDITEMQHLLNIRPRETLGWQNPAEALNVALTT